MSSINRILRKIHLEHGPMCMELSAHVERVSHLTSGNTEEPVNSSSRVLWNKNNQNGRNASFPKSSRFIPPVYTIQLSLFISHVNTRHDLGKLINRGGEVQLEITFWDADVMCVSVCVCVCPVCVSVCVYRAQILIIWYKMSWITETQSAAMSTNLKVSSSGTAPPSPQSRAEPLSKVTEKPLRPPPPPHTHTHTHTHTHKHTHTHTHTLIRN